MALKLVEGYEFRRRNNNVLRWHIARKNGNPGELPLCSMSGAYHRQADMFELKDRRHLCPVCLEVAVRSGILMGYKPRQKKKEK